MTETAKLADVVLPATCFAEKDGTFTNSERRVQRVRKAVDPPGEARPDWQIICDVSTAMGYPMQYASPSEVFDEMACLTPSYGGMSYAADRQGRAAVAVPDARPPRHRCSCTRGDSRAASGLLHVIKFRPPAEVPDDEYPFVLSTGRTLYHYNIGNMTRKSAADQPEAGRELRRDARRGRRSGWASPTAAWRGSPPAAARSLVRAHVADKVRPGALWMPFHFVETATNRLTNDAFDNVTRTGEYKCCAAKVEKAEPPST